MKLWRYFFKNKNKKWTLKEKEKIVKEHLNGLTINQLREKYNIKSTGTITGWKNKYLKGELIEKIKGRKKYNKDVEYEILKKSYALLMEIRNKPRE